ncbi:hypothetical protein IV203_027309 [Nitzschia inconspicua]|uniref:Uncharacterized protein n=1 Tax=Nitzschia inconspicua TaxID=303405 RepID=A0A9K3LW21_9STRA|nr:hypothetical protein IV203_027309 [Nitzschia inconspicua]
MISEDVNSSNNSTCEEEDSTLIVADPCSDALNSTVSTTTSSVVRNCVTFDTTLNRYYKRKGSWLNKTALYYSHAQLKEMKAEAVTLAKSLEESSSSDPRAMRGLESLPPNALKAKMDRRQRARQVVFQAQKNEMGTLQTLPELYGQACEEAVTSAINVAKRDSQDILEIRKEVEDYTKRLMLLLQEKEGRNQLRDDAKIMSIPSPKYLFSLQDVKPSRKVHVRAEPSSFHTDITFSAASSVCSDVEDLETFDHKKVALKNAPPTQRFKKAVFSLGKKLRRAATNSAMSSTVLQ